jgi:hypothetical protein
MVLANMLGMLTVIDHSFVTIVVVNECMASTLEDWCDRTSEPFLPTVLHLPLYFDSLSDTEARVVFGDVLCEDRVLVVDVVEV